MAFIKMLPLKNVFIKCWNWTIPFSKRLK